MAHTEVDLRERRLIEDMLNAKTPVSRIAEELCRHRSSVYWGIKRSRFVDDELPYLNGYYGMVARKDRLEPAGQAQEARTACGLARGGDRATEGELVTEADRRSSCVRRPASAGEPRDDLRLCLRPGTSVERTRPPSSDPSEEAPPALCSQAAGLCFPA